MPTSVRRIIFRSGSLESLRKFTAEARRDAGYQLESLQLDIQPDDWGPIGGNVEGLHEIRMSDDSGVLRMVCVVIVKEIIYVLHCYQRTSPKSNQRDAALINARHQELIEELLIE